MHPALAPYRVDLFNNLAKKFTAIFYFYYPDQAYHSFESGYLQSKCSFEINYIKSGFTLKKRFFAFGIWKILKKEKPEIVLCCEFNQVTILTLIYYYLSAKKFRMYTFCDDSMEIAKKRKGFRLLLRRFIAKRIDGVIFPSSIVGDWYNNNVSSKIKAFELPIIHDDFNFRNQLNKSIIESNRLIEKFKLNGVKIILFVGRLAEVKNVSMLLKSCGRIKSKDWKLVVIGEGPLELELKNEGNMLNVSKNILFLGQRQGIGLYAWFNISQIFVLPSIYEPFGAVVNEALLGGCKVLCSKVAGASTLINEKNGILFDPTNAKEFEEKLDQLLKSIDGNPHTIHSIRESTMPFSFQDKIDILIPVL